MTAFGIVSECHQVAEFSAAPLEWTGAHLPPRERRHPSKARAPSMYREDPHTLLSIYLRVDLLSRGQRPAVETLMSGNPECILDPKALTKDEAIVF